MFRRFREYAEKVGRRRAIIFGLVSLVLHIVGAIAIFVFGVSLW